jgi:di/tricarboxylate transporter
MIMIFILILSVFLCYYCYRLGFIKGFEVGVSEAKDVVNEMIAELIIKNEKELNK